MVKSPPKNKQHKVLKPVASVKTDMSRPEFNSGKQRAARLEYSLATGDKTIFKANLTERNLASPHRLPFALIRQICFNMNYSVSDIEKKTEPLLTASSLYEEHFLNLAEDKAEKSNSNELKDLANLYAMGRQNVITVI